MYNDDRGDRIGLIDRGDSSEDRDPLDASLRLNLSDVRHVDVRGDSAHDRRLLDDRGGSLGRRLLDNARRFLRCQGVRLGVDLVFEFKGPRRRRGHESLRFELIIKDLLRFLLDFLTRESRRSRHIHLFEHLSGVELVAELFGGRQLFFIVNARRRSSFVGVPRRRRRSLYLRQRNYKNDETNAFVLRSQCDSLY